MPNKRKIAYIFILVLAIISIWFVFAFFPSGTSSYKYIPGKHSLLGGKGFFGQFSPDTRVVYHDNQADLSGDPIYFSFYSARPISQLDLDIKYSGDLSPDKPIVEAGVLMDKKAGNYQLLPVENYWLDQYSNWPSYSKDGVIVFDRQGNYNSVQDFLSALDSGNVMGCSDDIPACVGTYHYDYRFNSKIRVFSDIQKIASPISGSHELYTVVASDNIVLSFLARDAYESEDRKIAFEAYSVSGEKITSKEYEVPETGKLDDNFSVLGLQTGEIIKIIIKADKNISIDNLSVNSSKLSFIGHLNLSGSSFDREIFTDKSFILIQGSNPSLKGEYSLAGEKFDVDSTYKQFSFRTSQDLPYYPIFLHYDNLEVANNGVFAFNSQALVNPNAAKVDQYFSPNSKIQYIIARYDFPEDENEYKLARVSLDMVGAYRENNRYQLIFSLPEPFSASSSQISIYSIEAKAQAKSLWSKLKEIIHQ